MRIVILLLLIPSSAIATGVDWEKLNKEMEYLRQNAFVDVEKPNKKEVIKEDPKKAFDDVKRNYSLQRKPKMTRPTDPNILPLEQQFFDEVKFKYSAPKRKNMAPESKGQIKRSIETPSIPSLDF